MKFTSNARTRTYTAEIHFYDQALRAFKHLDQDFRQANTSEEYANLRNQKGELSERRNFIFIGEDVHLGKAYVHHAPSSATIVLRENYSPKKSAAHIIGAPSARNSTKLALERLTGFKLVEETPVVTAR